MENCTAQILWLYIDQHTRVVILMPCPQEIGMWMLGDVVKKWIANTTLSQVEKASQFLYWRFWSTGMLSQVHGMYLASWGDTNFTKSQDLVSNKLPELCHFAFCPHTSAHRMSPWTNVINWCFIAWPSSFC